MFILLKSGESDTLTDITSEFPHVMNKIRRTYSDFDKPTKKMMRDMMGDVFKLTRTAVKEKYFDKKNDILLDEVYYDATRADENDIAITRKYLVNFMW